MSPGALPWLCLLVPVLAADPKSWCQAKHGKCTGQRHSFKARMPTDSPGSLVHLWDRVLDDRRSWHRKGVRFADWDFDGDLDLIVAEKGDWEAKKWQLSVLEQVANGSFIPHRLATVDLDTFAVADWNSDGGMDVLVCHARNETVIVSRFDLSPASSPEVILNTSRDPCFCIVRVSLFGKG